MAILSTLSLGLSMTAGAASGYPGTTTVTTVPGGSYPPGGTGTPTPGGLTGPGGQTGPGASTSGNPFDPGTGSSGSSGTLAFTGADLLAIIVGGLFLLAMGTLLVVFTRRRASHQRI